MLRVLRLEVHQKTSRFFREEVIVRGGRAGRHAGPGRTRRRGAARARDIRARHQGARPATPPSSPAPASRLHILPSSSRIGTSDAHAYFPLPRTQVSRVRIARLFATVEACGATFRSTCRVSTPSPVWNEAGVVPLSDDWEGRRARVVMWDRTLSGRPVRLGRRDVPLVNLRANGNGGASWMDLNLVTRGGEGKGTTRAAGTVRVAMEVRTSAAGRDGSDGGDGGVEPGDETVDETVAESAVDDANEDEDEVEVDAATRSAAGEATVSSTVSSKAATFSAALAAAKRDEPAPRTPSTPTVTPTVSFATPIVVSAPSSTSSSLAASTASLRSKLVDAGRVADAAECRAFAFRAEFEFDDSSVNASSSSARTKEGSSGEPRRECTGRELSRVFGWSARTPPRHPTATVHVAGKENRPPDVGEDNRMTAPVTHHPVTHRRVTHRPARGSPVAELDSAMAAGGRAAPRTDAIDSARRALAKARVFGGERASVLERTVPLEAPGAWKKPSSAFDAFKTSDDDDAEHEERREVRRLARVFARADSVFASWSL